MSKTKYGTYAKKLGSSRDNHLINQTSHKSIMANIAYSDIWMKIPQDIKLISIDVFDTLLLRNDKSESRRFFEIAELIHSYLVNENINISPESIFLARYLATETSYRLSAKKKGCREGSANEIYKITCRIIGLDISFWREMLNIEIEYEQHNTQLNKLLWDNFLKKANELGCKIILTSDMYLHGDQIEKIISYHENKILNSIEHVYSSADCTVSKASGYIFNVILKDIQVQPKECLHIGDSFYGDYVSPKKLGWNAIYMPIEEGRKIKIKNDFLSFRDNLREKYITIPQIERSNLI